MNAENRRRWEQELRDLQGKLKNPTDLLARVLGPDDFVDAAIIGGIPISDILAGKVAEWQIPEDVKDAFHAQYPHVTRSFVQEVHHLSHSPAELQGFVNGVKGKLFEIDYVHWLNSGHLPAGLTAELAHNANNPAWDVVIHDAHGHVDAMQQLKATSSWTYVHTALSSHPDIDVVVPHDVYEQMAGHHDAFLHVLDAPQHLDQMSQHVGDAVQHADTAGVFYLLPALAYLFIARQSYSRYRNGDLSLSEAIQYFGKRSLLNVAAWGLGKVATVTMGTKVGIPVGIGMRLIGGQALHNTDQRKLLDARLIIIRDAHNALYKKALPTSS